MKKNNQYRGDPFIFEEIKRRAELEEKAIGDYIDEIFTAHIQQTSVEDFERIYSPLIERYMSTHFKNFENRIAGLLAKNALDSGMSMFMLVDYISKQLDIDRDKLYERMRSISSKHVMKREELMGILDDYMNLQKKDKPQ